MNYIKSKGKYVVKDGLFKYIVDISNLKCQCLIIDKNKINKNKYCEHINFILKKEHNLSDFSIKYMHHIMNNANFNNFINRPTNSNNLNNLDNEIRNKLNSHECAVCLSNISVCDNETTNLNIFECSNCRNIVHKTCMDRWLIKNVGCVYCRH